MIVAFSIAPAGPDDSGSYAAAVAEAVRIVRASGLPHETNAMFTNIEGEWDEVMAVLKECVDAMTASTPRLAGRQGRHPDRSHRSARRQGGRIDDLLAAID